MMAGTAGSVPEEYADDHVLVVPAGAALPERARAWFAGAGWLREPLSADEASARVPRLAGARFRGVVARAPAEPGVLGVGEAFTAVGPFPVTAEQRGLLGVPDGASGFALHPAVPVQRGPVPLPEDRDGLGRAFASGAPLGEELRVLRWAVAVARDVGGVLVTSTREVLAPPPESSVDLTLYSAHPLSAGQTLPLLRKVQPGARLVSEEQVERGPAGFALVAESAYDGDLHVWMQRAPTLPRALEALDWREHGPFAYRLLWRPVDAYELELERPSGTHVIARARLRAAVARLALSLGAAVGGTVVGDGGFVVGHDGAQGLRARAAATSVGLLWG
ncbi:hypothetical protein [Cellulomonas sp. PhB143]|uniref:hypothetical protein n=1 Tax=Cellulomonas sp. PhB143 TaxID=2485186 RepID=UPI000F48D582|nr:hypothetical protein [Cellulomonas sp. PhB143]ROS76457.1 hypothetical protein EDF32_1270 [Cellulomonas sp. PhB143]